MLSSNAVSITVNTLLAIDIFKILRNGGISHRDLLSDKIRSGPIFCECKKANREIVDSISSCGVDIDVRLGDTIAELHVDPFDFSFNELGLHLSRIEDELIRVTPTPKYIIGISNLAKFSLRYGYCTKEIYSGERSKHNRLCWKKLDKIQ